MHVGTTIVSTALVSLLVAGLAIVPRRRNWLSQCESLTKRLAPHRLDQLVMVAARSRNADTEFTAASDGLRGVMRWLLDTTVLVRLIQINVHKGTIEPGDAMEPYRDALAQGWCSLWAIPEAALGVVWQGVPRVAARAAFGYHHSLSLRATNLLAFTGAPDCLINSGNML